MKRNLPAILILTAVAIAAFVVLRTINARKAIALAAAEQAAAEMKTAAHKELAAKKSHAEAEARKEEAEKKAREEEARVKANQLEWDAQQLSKSNDVARAAAARDDRLAQEAKAQAAADEKTKSENELKIKLALKDAEEARARAADAEAKKAQAEEKISENEMLKLKYSQDELERLKAQCEREIVKAQDMQRKLDEQLQALKPEKTILDLATVENETSQSDVHTNTVKAASDPFETQASKELKELNRLRCETAKARAGKNREETIAALEQLMKDAMREQRPIDAKYYFQTLLTLYPDWKPTL